MSDGIKPGTRVRMGQKELVFGETIEELRSSNDILDDMDALRERMEEEGYLLLRGLQDRRQVLAARGQIVAVLQKQGRLREGSNPDDAEIAPEAGGTMIGHEQIYGEMPAFIDLVQSDRIMKFYEDFLQGPSMTYDYKWLRVVGKEGYTGFHYDVVYMGRGTHDLYTCWTPLGDISLDMGTLVLCLGSQHFNRLRETYGAMDVDRDKVRGWFSDDPFELMEKFGGRLATTDFRAGDILTFGMFMMHGSTNNVTNRFRLSCDTRYQRAGEPVDERWVGKTPMAHYAWHKGEGLSMEQARAKWGV